MDDEVKQWLNNDENDPGYEYLHNDEIVAHVMRGSADVGEIDGNEDEPEVVVQVCPVIHAQAMESVSLGFNINLKYQPIAQVRKYH